MKHTMTVCGVSNSQLKISACHRFACKKHLQPLTGSDGTVPAVVSLSPIPGYA